jgi:hypothetical protein
VVFVCFSVVWFLIYVKSGGGMERAPKYSSSRDGEYVVSLDVCDMLSEKNFTPSG